MFAVGKTTFMKDNMDDLADGINDNLDLTVVLADLQSEYHLVRMGTIGYSPNASNVGRVNVMRS